MYFSLSVIIIIFCIICYKNIKKEKKEELQLEIITEKETYETGEWILYSVIIANNSEQSVYYNVSSCNVEIIGENGFHAITDIDNDSNIYELKPDSKVKRNMTGYNQYHDFAHVMGIKTFTGDIRLKNTIDSVAKLNLNWTTGLCLPEGNYTFLAEFLYYDDTDCLNEPQKITTSKKIHVISDGSSKIEEEILLEERLRFYATSDKNIYQTGETIHSWGKIEPLEGKWYRWYERNDELSITIYLINCDTGEKVDIYNHQAAIFEEYTDPFFILPNFIDERGIVFYKWLKEEGNYIIQYWLKYFTYETQEPKIVTIDLPITVIPNKSEQAFYSSRFYPVKAFEEYDDNIP